MFLFRNHGILDKVKFLVVLFGLLGHEIIVKAATRHWLPYLLSTGLSINGWHGWCIPTHHGHLHLLHLLLHHHLLIGHGLQLLG